MIRRFTLCTVFALTLLSAPCAHAQYANHTGNVAGTVGGTCVSTANDYAWPDTNGAILKCVSNVWTLVTLPVAAAGSTGDVQFNSSGALAASANLFWDNTNFRLGIGTAVPQYMLDIGTASTGLARIGEVETGNWPANTTGGYAFFGNQSISQSSAGNYAMLQDSGGGTYLNAATNQNIYFRINNASEMMLNSQGNFGIGTTAPGQPLTVTGAIESIANGLFPTATANGQAILFAGSASGAILLGQGSAYDLVLGDDTGGDALGIPHDTTNVKFFGTVGINTTPSSSPLTSLQIAGFTASGATSYGLSVAADTGATNNYAAVFTGGSVGIGTTSPQSLLQVNGGEVQVGSSGVSCSAATAGAIRYSGGSLTYCNGSIYTAPPASAAGSTGQIQFNNGGSLGADSNLNWDNTNKRVGIGTAVPGDPLEIYANTVSNGSINELMQINPGTMNLATAGSAATIAFKYLSGSYAGMVGGYGNGSATGIGIWNGTGTGAPAVYVTGGNVGIGTTSPSANLDIGGAASPLLQLTSNNGGGQIWLKPVNGTGSYFGTTNGIPLQFYTNNAEQMRITSTGSVGIGTTSPQSLLQINGGEVQVGSSGVSCSAATAGAIRYSGGSLTYCNGSIYTAPPASAAGSTGQIQFNNGGSLGADSNLNWDNTNKRVGIGTAAPADTFDVAVAQNASTTIRASNTDSTDVSTAAVVAATADVASTAIISGGSGNTATNYGIAHAGYGELESNVGNGLLIGTRSNATPIIFGTNNLERMRILSSGFVGIGTAAPGYKLDVAGDINLSAGSYLRQNGHTALITSAAATFNTFVGQASGTPSLFSGGLEETSVGYGALQSGATGQYETAVGVNALDLSTAGISNTAVGANALSSDTGSYNTALGGSAGANITTGSQNIIIGYAINAPVATGTGQINIGNAIYATGATGTGSTPAGNVGIGTTAPGSTLEVNGHIKSRQTYQTGSVTVNGSGTWQTVTFPTAFTSTPVVTGAMSNLVGGYYGFVVIAGSTLSTTSFQFIVITMQNAIDTAGDTVSWIAVAQ